MALEYAEFRVVDRRVVIRSIGIEVDFIAEGKQGIAFYITAKGSMRGERPGSSRTDTLKKALCDAFLLEQEGIGPVLLFTSHIPTGGNGLAMLISVRRSTLFDVLNPWMHSKRLAWLSRVEECDLEQDMSRTIADLLRHQWHIETR